MMLHKIYHENFEKLNKKYLITNLKLTFVQEVRSFHFVVKRLTQFVYQFDLDIKSQEIIPVIYVLSKDRIINSLRTV